MEVYNAMTRLVDSYGDPTDLKQFRKFIQNFLVFTVEPDHDPRRDMTTPEFMRYWINAFTHETYDAQNNYEILEFLGDEDLSGAFKPYLYHHHKIDSEHIITNLKNYYLSEKYQPFIAKTLHFDRWIRIHPDVPLTDKILEDVLEACFGALQIIARKLYLQDRTKYLYPQELVLRFFIVYFTGNALDVNRGLYVWKTTFLDYWKFFADVLKNPYYDQTKNVFVLTDQFYDGIIRRAPSHAIGTRIVRELKRLDLKSLIAEKQSITQDNQTEAMVKIFLAEGLDPEWIEEQGRNFTFRGDAEIDRIAKANKFTRFKIEPYYSEDANKTKFYKLLAQSVDPENKMKTKSLQIHLFKDVKDIKQQARRVIIEMYGRSN